MYTRGHSKTTGVAHAAEQQSSQVLGPGVEIHNCFLLTSHSQPDNQGNKTELSQNTVAQVCFVWIWGAIVLEDYQYI